MIRKVVIRGFKRFQVQEFDLQGQVVLAGPNNAGKTTVLQAIAAWALAFQKWREAYTVGKPFGHYQQVPIARQEFAAVPLRAFDLLWTNRNSSQPIEIQVWFEDGRNLAMEMIPNSTEQVYLRPKDDNDHNTVKSLDPQVMFVPPMTGISTDEPVYQKPYQRRLLGQGRPGEIIRNLIVEARDKPEAWQELTATIQRLFGYTLLPPNDKAAVIIAEYECTTATGTLRLDIASAGSGFQQVLMLLAFLHTAPRGSVLLFDEPDAHLHIILQDAIFGELRRAAAMSGSKLILATHSEVIINTAEPEEVCMLLETPRRLSTVGEREKLARALGLLEQTDVMLALQCPGILYVEGHTDLALLREWARILNHPTYDFLSKRLFWKPIVWEPRPGAKGIAAKDHFEMLQLVRADIPGLLLMDGDDNPKVTETELTGTGLQRRRWQRYEVESYLVHPAAIERFVDKMLGPGDASAPAKQKVRDYFEQTFRPAFLADPLQPEELVRAYLQSTKARTKIIPPILAEAGFHGFDYTRYSEIAALMKPEEIHPEVREKLDAIITALRL